MNQRRKNIALLGILIFLAICSVLLSVIDNSSSSTISDKDIFSVSDTSQVDRISIKSSKISLELKRIDKVWLLDEGLKAEQNIVKILLAILRDTEVSRSVPNTQNNAIINLIKEKGYLVEIYGDGDILASFYSCGNENKTISYMMDPEDMQPYIVNIPGYGSYVAGIFEIPRDGWRDKLIISTNWRSLQELKVNYTEFPEYDFTIKFGFNFLSIEGVEALDTTAMMGYIENFNYLQADKYLKSGQNNRYDSLLKTPSTVEISIEDIDKSKSKKIQFFPLLQDDPMMLGYVIEDKQRVIFEAKRIQNLFAVKSDFERKEK